jgi:hypothetical protein
MNTNYMGEMDREREFLNVMIHIYLRKLDEALGIKETKDEK